MNSANDNFLISSGVFVIETTLRTILDLERLETLFIRRTTAGLEKLQTLFILAIRFKLQGLESNPNNFYVSWYCRGCVLLGFIRRALFFTAPDI